MINSYPWYIADWRGSQARLLLNLEERALYRELIDFCYLERSLPTNERMLARIANCSDEEFSRTWHNVQTMFFEVNGRYHHKKVDEVLERLDGYHEQKRKAGKASGERRRNARSTGVEIVLPKKATKNEPSLTSFTSSSNTDDKTAPTPQHLVASPKGKNGISKNLTTTDDKTKFASPKDALIALMISSMGRKPDVGFFRGICETIEVHGGSIQEFTADMTERIKRLREPPGEGFFRSEASKVGSIETAPVLDPKIEQPKNGAGRCAYCNGIGQLADGFCSCAMGQDLARIAARKKPQPQQEAS